jgi:hypothetical protein
MLGIYGYLTGWAVYLIAGATCYLLFYCFTGMIRFKPLANTLRAIMLALIFTPWYVAADQDLMAPAVLVIILDVITLGGTAFVRAFVPLLMAIFLALILALAGGVLRNSMSRRFNKTDL